VKRMKKIMFSIKNITTTPIPTAGKSAYLQEEEIWGNGPVPFTPKGYSLAAAGLESVIYEKKAEEKEEGLEDGREPRRDQKKTSPRTGRTELRGACQRLPEKRPAARQGRPPVILSGEEARRPEAAGEVPQEGPERSGRGYGTESGQEQQTGQEPATKGPGYERSGCKRSGRKGPDAKDSYSFFSKKNYIKI
jgi:hypothetical protein